MTTVKAILLGVVISWVFSSILGAQGSGWGQLYIHMVEFHVHLGNLETIRYYWSWPLFFASAAIAWGIMALMA